MNITNISIIFLKALIKLANIFGWFYTQLCLFFPRDPTAIFIKNRTQAQISQLDKAHSSSGARNFDALPSRQNKLWVIIPFRDRWDLTQRCLQTLFTQTHNDFELGIILIDNNSSESKTERGLKEFREREKTSNIDIKLLKVSDPFNFSALNNLAVQTFALDDDWIFFLNNDVEFIVPESLTTLLSFALSHKEHLGALGCTLMYPSQRIQHLFAAPGIKIVAAHPGKGWKLNKDCLWFQTPQPVASVTGASLLCLTEHFRRAGGFDKLLPTLGQDIDLCLKFQKLGLANWVLPQVTLIHAESASKSSDFNVDEIMYIYEKWGEFLTFNPYYASKFSRWSETPIYSLTRWQYPWARLLNTKKDP